MRDLALGQGDSGTGPSPQSLNSVGLQVPKQIMVPVQETIMVPQVRTKMVPKMTTETRAVTVQKPVQSECSSSRC